MPATSQHTPETPSCVVDSKVLIRTTIVDRDVLTLHIPGTGLSVEPELRQCLLSKHEGMED